MTVQTPRPTRLAIGSLVLACAGAVWPVSALNDNPLMLTLGLGAGTAGAGAVLGHVARRRGRSSDGGGYDLGLAAAIIGWIFVAFGLLAMGVNHLFISLDAGTG